MTQTRTDPGAGAISRLSRLIRLRPPLVLVGGLLLASVALHLRDPHRSGSWFYCPWYVMTGTYCPGCGGLRAVNDLTNGDVLGAASSNLLFVGSLPLLAFWWLRWVRDSWRGVRRTVDPRAVSVGATVFVVLAIAFAVARNLPFGGWLAP